MDRVNDDVGEAARSDTASLGALLRHYRRRAGLTQEELAERAGISVRGIGNIERGVPQRVRKETIRLLAEALDLTIAEQTVFLELARRGALSRACETPGKTGATNESADDPATLVTDNLSSWTAVPRPFMPLVGREHEMAMAHDYLCGDEPQLLTFCGPGGVGKTRLAVQLAIEADADFADGVRFVPLAPIRDANLVGLTIMQCLGLRTTGVDDAITVVRKYLANRRILLVLDNFEHVLAARPLIASLIAACSQLKVLITSRSPLHLQGEQVFPVLPLALPASAMASSAGHFADILTDRRPDIETLSQTGAIAFFLQRARAIEPAFVLTATNAAPIVRICQRLDGLPLAIELAVTRLRVFSVQELSVRLERALPLLTGGPHDLPMRQQTLRNTMAWSYHLLGAEEQALFRSLAVISGGCSWEALEAISQDVGVLLAEDTGKNPQDPQNPQDAEQPLVMHVTCLLDQHLLERVQTPDGVSRYWFLETIREFAQELLEQSGETDRVERAHARYYLAKAEAVEPLLRGKQQKAWLAWLEAEHDNLRAALRWTLRQRDAILALRLAGALGWFWYSQGYLSEGRGWLEKALSMPEPEPEGLAADSADRERVEMSAHSMPTMENRESVESSTPDRVPLARWHALRAKALHAAGLLACYQGEYQNARMLNEEALALRRSLNDLRGAAHTINNLALILARQGDDVGAAKLYEESLALKRKIGDGAHLATTLANLGRAYVDNGDYANAKRVYESCLDQWRADGDDYNVARTLANLGEIALREGHYARAGLLLEGSLKLRQPLGDRVGLANTMHLLGKLAYAQGDAVQSFRCFQQSCEVLLTVGGDTRGIVSNLEALALLLCTELELERAVWLSSAAEALRERLYTPPKPYEQTAIERTLALEHAGLDDPAFARAWEKGSLMTLEEIWTEIRSTAIAAQSARTHRTVLPSSFQC